MPKFNKSGKEIYFVHIPRTAGRHVINLFLNNDWNMEDFDEHEQIRGVNKHHLHYPLYDYYLNTKDLPKFCVVRCPYYKFISSISQVAHNNNIDIDSIFSTKENLFDYLTFEKEITSYETNWFLDQYKFISPTTKIWKYEYGFGDSFLLWLKNTFDITLNLCKDYSYDFLLTDFYNKISPNCQVKKWICEYYSKDYKIFNYKLY
jgi:hypothetical protein